MTGLLIEAYTLLFMLNGSHKKRDDYASLLFFKMN